MSRIKPVAMRMLVPYLRPLTLLVVTIVAMVIAVPEFRGQSAVYGVLQQFPLVGLLALAVGVTMMAGELDLSVASMASLTSVVAAAVSGGGIIVMILVGVGAGVAIGVVQGYLIARLRINSLMFTIGTLIMLNGLSYVVANNKTLFVSNTSLSAPFLNRYGSIFSIGSIWTLGTFIVLWAFLTWTRPGRHIFAVGGGSREAEAAGISRTRVLPMVFGISGLCAGFAGVIQCLLDSSAEPAQYALFLLPAVAAALIGGLALSGGRGSVMNVFLGVAVLGTISAALVDNGTSNAVAQIVEGGLLLVLLTLEFGSLVFVPWWNARSNWRIGRRAQRLTADGP